MLTTNITLEEWTPVHESIRKPSNEFRAGHRDSKQIFIELSASTEAWCIQRHCGNQGLRGSSGILFFEFYRIPMEL